MKIVAIGGTGLIGSKTVASLRRRGRSAFPASPNTGVNSITGQGPKGAMAGPEGKTIRLSPGMLQSIAADDVAAFVSEAAIGPSRPYPFAVAHFLMVLLTMLAAAGMAIGCSLSPISYTM